MASSVYIETTIASYLTARPSRNLVLAARQELTREWWEEGRSGFALCTSQYVLDEARDGNPEVVERRLSLLEGLPVLETGEDVEDLAEALILHGILSRSAATDALHIAVATIHEIDILLTWNCRHLANARILGPVGRFLRARGFEPPIICTPDELMGE